MGLSTGESWPVWSRCFSGAAVETFSYLIPKGFAPTRVEPYLVVYRFGETYLRVFLGRRSRAVAMEIVRRGQKYHTSTIIRAADREAALAYQEYIPQDEAGVWEGLAGLKQILMRFGERALKDDPMFYSELDRRRKEWAVEYEWEVRAEQLRPRAREALRLHRYEAAVEHFEDFRESLTVAEEEQFEYAKRQAAERPWVVRAHSGIAKFLRRLRRRVRDRWLLYLATRRWLSDAE
jgi:hypothetical protein